jgi:CRISPR-associated protein Cmr5
MTLEQKRAAKAYEHVRTIAEKHAKESTERKQYAAMAQTLPVLIRTAGLCQALHFLQSRGGKDGRGVLGQLLEHIAGQLQRTSPGITDGNSLCSAVRNAPLPAYLWMTRETLATAEWYARLSQSELDVQKGTGD